MVLTSVDKPKRTVVVYEKDMVSEYKKIFDYMNVNTKRECIWLGRDVFTDSIKGLPRVCRGKAKCHPEDEWNEEYGSLLAKDRVNKRLKQVKNRYKTRLIKEFIKIVCCMVDKTSHLNIKVELSEFDD